MKFQEFNELLDKLKQEKANWPEGVWTDLYQRNAPLQEFVSELQAGTKYKNEGLSNLVRNGDKWYNGIYFFLFLPFFFATFEWTQKSSFIARYPSAISYACESAGDKSMGDEKLADSRKSEPDWCLEAQKMGIETSTRGSLPYVFTMSAIASLLSILMELAWFRRPKRIRRNLSPIRVLGICVGHYIAAFVFNIGLRLSFLIPSEVFSGPVLKLALWISSLFGIVYLSYFGLELTLSRLRRMTFK